MGLLNCPTQDLVLYMHLNTIKILLLIKKERKEKIAFLFTGKILSSQKIEKLVPAQGPLKLNN